MNKDIIFNNLESEMNKQTPINSLDCSGARFKEIPNIILELNELETIDLGGNPNLNFDDALSMLSNLPKLRNILLWDCKLTLNNFPHKGISHLKRLKCIDLMKSSHYKPVLNFFTYKDQNEIISKHRNLEIIFPLAGDDINNLDDFGSIKIESFAEQLQDPYLKHLYWHLKYAPYKAFQSGLSHIDDSSDILGMLQGIQEALTVLISKYKKLINFGWEKDKILSEKGFNFGYNDIKYFEDHKIDVEARVNQTLNSGFTSQIFQQYKKL